jgi:SAM-dependent methyltransferase/uncharacterized protein YbaR (Trm112 family)
MVGMHERMLEILACPRCGGALRLSGATGSGDEISSGALSCQQCPADYPLLRGVPRLLPPTDNADGRQAGVAEHFTEEFTALSAEDADFDAEDLLAYFFYSRTGLDPNLYERLPGDHYRTELPTGDRSYTPSTEYLHGRRVLDAGAGPGRFTALPVEAGARHVVALDLGEHVDRAAARLADRPEVDVVQGSVLQPPFRPGSFDYVFSLGVLHHTPDPATGVTRLAALLAEGGGLSVWVYPPEYWGGTLRGAIGRRVHAYISKQSPSRSLELCRTRLLPLGRAQMRLASRRWTKLAGAPLFLVAVPRHPDPTVMLGTIHDYFGAPIISTHTDEELRGWFDAAGLTGVRSLPVPTSAFGTR